MTYCNGENCPLREKCLRYSQVMELDRYWQMSPAYNPETNQCINQIERRHESK